MRIRTKAISYFLLAGLLTMFLLPGCTKEGPQGPAGSTGAQGETGKDGIPGKDGTPGKDGAAGQDGKDGKDGLDGKDGVDGKDGLDGENGVAGKDGATILAGSGSPDISVGVVGDYYLDNVNVSLYGPKTSAGWGSGISLKGTPGSRVLHGEGVPTSATGEIDDYYFDELVGTVYGPKSSAGWGPGFSLKGDEGPQGPPGAANVKIYALSNNRIPAWTYTGSSYYMRISLSAITQDVIQKGLVQVYVKLSDGLLYTVPYYNLKQVVYASFSAGVLQLYAPENSPAPENPVEIKIVIANGTSYTKLNVKTRRTFGDYIGIVRKLKD